MANKKADMSIETVIWVAIALTVFLVIGSIIFVAFPKLRENIMERINNPDESVKGMDVGENEKVVAGETNTFALTNGEKGNLNLAVDNNVMTAAVIGTDGAEIKCNYGAAWTFKPGESKCCESAASDLCITYKGVSSGTDNEDIIDRNIFSKSEWPIPSDESPQKLCEVATNACADSFDIWLSNGKIRIELASVSPPILRHAHLHIYKFNDKGEKIEICQNNNDGGSNFAVNSRGNEDCSEGNFNLAVIDLDQNAKPPFVFVSVKKIETATGGGGW